jgi:hypothetical protein
MAQPLCTALAPLAAHFSSVNQPIHLLFSLAIAPEVVNRMNVSRTAVIILIANNFSPFIICVAKLSFSFNSLTPMNETVKAISAIGIWITAQESTGQTVQAKST